MATNRPARDPKAAALHLVDALKTMDEVTKHLEAAMIIDQANDSKSPIVNSLWHLGDLIEDTKMHLKALTYEQIRIDREHKR